MKVGDSIKKRLDELNSLSDEELKKWADKQLEEARKIEPIRTKWSFQNPNECYVTPEEFDKLNPVRIFIENGKPDQDQL